eukprot:1238528-Alexandrium_andersonii.AAC.1
MRNSSAVCSFRRRTCRSCRCQPQPCFLGGQSWGGGCPPDSLVRRWDGGWHAGPLARLPQPAGPYGTWKGSWNTT